MSYGRRKTNCLAFDAKIHRLRIYGRSLISFFTYLNFFSCFLNFNFKPLQIKSVVIKEGLKGMIYVEAYKQTHVVQAIEGISALNHNKIQVMNVSRV